MRILVAGGTGVVGRPLVEALVAAGHDVTATTHRSDGRSLIEALGARATRMEGLDKDSVREAVREAKPDVIVNQITSLSESHSDYGTWLANTNRLRIHATAALVGAAREVGTSRMVAQSASFMTQPDGPGPTDETSPLYVEAPEPIRGHVLANVSAEHDVTGTAGVNGVVLRYGFLYGPGTAIGPGGDIATAIAAGEMPIVGEGAGRYPLIHVRDAVSATLRAIDGTSTGVFNIVDDEPAAQGDLLPYLAKLLDAPPPQHISVQDAVSRIGPQAAYYGEQLPPASNARAKVDLGMTLEYPSWRTGLRHVFA